MTSDWKEIGETLKNMLRLRTKPVGYKKYESTEELDAIPNLESEHYEYILDDM